MPSSPLRGSLQAQAKVGLVTLAIARLGGEAAPAANRDREGAGPAGLRRRRRGSQVSGLGVGGGVRGSRGHPGVPGRPETPD